ncbi:MAG: MFS transporter [Agathobacter sp.]|nr:MFS transporter [Agathobacter sp.]
MKRNYKKTLIACYMAFITQAIVANFTPLLFLKFHKDYNIPLGTIALISSVFFFSQIVVDLFCARFVDKIGYRKSIVASEIFAGIGLIGLAVLPDILSNPFAGIIISVILYAIGSGLIEVLASPIVEACPFDNKDSVMSLLHSFYCWGSLAVILISSLFFTIFGIENWRWIVCIWALVPLCNIYNFVTCPIESLVDDGQGLSIKALFRLPMFWVCLVLMVCAGASELSMAQWASAYAEAALGLSKTMGDLVGPCLFALTMGISRVFYGKYGDKVDLKKFMLGSGVLCLACYILASVSCNPIIGLLGCIICGASVGIMWPGTISISSQRINKGGTAMFALLAMAGDMGGTIGPSIVGRIAQANDDALQIGLRVGSVFPVILIISILILTYKKENSDE